MKLKHIPDKCNAKTNRFTFFLPHVCGLPKGHGGQHCCKRELDSGILKLNKKKICNFKWNKRAVIDEVLK